MADTADLIKKLDFLAPGLAAVSAEDKTQALEIAAAFRPSCLSEAEQDLAQVYYAAWLLFDRQRQTAGQDSGIGPQPAGVKSIKEGDVTVTWADGAQADGVADPYGFYGQWKALADVCGIGAILVGTWRQNGCCPRY